MHFRNNYLILFVVITMSLFSLSGYADRAADIEKLFILAEDAYPDYYSPSPAATQTFNQWIYRYYSETDIYAGVNMENQVYVVGGVFGRNPVYVGQLDALLNPQNECSESAGPYATQTTAWQRWREAQDLRYAVSNGVFPCYDSYSTRGYCFNVFFAC